MAGLLPFGSPPTPDATPTVKGKNKLTNDLGGTADLPTVVATHLASALPVAQGGTAGTTAATARTNLGLDAGGAGDIWVEKAGDTMSGNLNLPSATLTGNINLPTTTSTTGQIKNSTTTLLHTYGGQNIFVGPGAGNLSMSGQNNAGIGASALAGNTTGLGNMAGGAGALQANTTGSNNMAFGTVALTANTTGSFNTAVGTLALTTHTTNNSNTAIGYRNLESSTADNNTCVGFAGLLVNTTGAQNTVMGYLAGYTAIGSHGNTTGSYNTFLGMYAGPGSTTQVTNSVALGYSVVVNTSNSVSIGSTLGVNGAINNQNIGFCVPDPQSKHQFQSNPIAATGTITSVGTAVTGSSTLFTTELKVNDMIIFPAYAQTRRVTAIADNTHLTIATAFAPDIAAGGAFTYSRAVHTIDSTGSALFRPTTNSTTAFQIQDVASTALFIADTTNLRIGIGITPTAKLHLAAGTATANTAPLKFTSGTNLTTAEAGAMEFDGTKLYFSPSTTRKVVVLAPTSPSAYTPTNVTTDRSFDANATTLDEIADALGTLIADLQTTGIIA